MKKSFKKLLVLLVVVTVVWLPAVAMSAKILDVSAGVHNLSTTGSIFYADSTVTEVCIFCHTPHASSSDAPLWNRVNPTISFTMYASSNPDAQADGTQSIRTESLICMSCHDGTVATNAIINENYEGQPDEQYLVALNDNPLALIGAIRQADGTVKPGTSPDGWETGHLDDDHPVSIDMAVVKATVTNNYGDGFNDPDALDGTHGVTVDLKFYGSGAERFVECATCHDPHVDYTTAGGEDHGPFLRMPNTNSAMCFACHNK